MIESSEIRKKINDSLVKVFSQGNHPANNNTQQSRVVFEDRGGDPLKGYDKPRGR